MFILGSPLGRQARLIRLTTSFAAEKNIFIKIYLMLNHQFIYINTLKRQLGIRIFVIKVI